MEVIQQLGIQVDEVLEEPLIQKMVKVLQEKVEPGTIIGQFELPFEDVLAMVEEAETDGEAVGMAYQILNDTGMSDEEIDLFLTEAGIIEGSTATRIVDTPPDVQPNEEALKAVEQLTSRGRSVVITPDES